MRRGMKRHEAVPRGSFSSFNRDRSVLPAKLRRRLRRMMPSVVARFVTGEIGLTTGAGATARGFDPPPRRAPMLNPQRLVGVGIRIQERPASARRIRQRRTAPLRSAVDSRTSDRDISGRRRRRSRCRGKRSWLVTAKENAHSLYLVMNRDGHFRIVPSTTVKSSVTPSLSKEASVASKASV